MKELLPIGIAFGVIVAIVIFVQSAENGKCARLKFGLFETDVNCRG